MNKNTSKTRELPEGSLACRSCGVAVRDPEPARIETMLVYGQRAASAAARGIPFVAKDISVTRCDDCAARRADAEALLAAHPRVDRENGNVGIDRLDAALAALDMGGFRRRQKYGSLAKTDGDLRVLISDFAPLGAAASWSVDFAGTGLCSTKRWAHVSDELMNRIAETYREVVHRHSETPAPFAPPNDGARGCLFCGVGTLVTKASKAPLAWGDLHRFQPGALGGKRQPEPIAGYLCPPCRAAVQLEGAPGVPAVERALLAHLGYSIRRGYVLDFPSWARAWITTASDSPNSEPWGHVNTARLSATLADLEQKMYVRKKVRS
jgi:hypothetical protein